MERGDGRGPNAHATCWTRVHAGLSSAAGAWLWLRGLGAGVKIKSRSVCRDHAFRIRDVIHDRKT